MFLSLPLPPLSKKGNKKWIDGRRKEQIKREKCESGEWRELGRERTKREREMKEERKLSEKREIKRECSHTFLKSKIKNIEPQPIILSYQIVSPDTQQKQNSHYDLKSPTVKLEQVIKLFSLQLSRMVLLGVLSPYIRLPGFFPSERTFLLLLGF